MTTSELLRAFRTILTHICALFREGHPLAARGFGVVHPKESREEIQRKLAFLINIAPRGRRTTLTHENDCSECEGHNGSSLFDTLVSPLKRGLCLYYACLLLFQSK